MEPLDEEAEEKFVFAREIIGNAIPPSFIPACEKGFKEATNSGHLIGHPVEVHPLPRPPPTFAKCVLYDAVRHVDLWNRLTKR
jgi:hypothetical protein